MKNQNSQVEYIVQNYSDFLLRLAMHHTKTRSDAEDLVQETLLKYIQKTPEFKDDEHMKAWLIRVLTNKAHDLHRSWWRSKTVSLKEDIKNEENDENYTVLPYIQKLPKTSRTAIYLFYYENYSMKQIAKIYHVKENTVASWLYRGRERLKVIMKGVDFNDMG